MSVWFQYITCYVLLQWMIFLYDLYSLLIMKHTKFHVCIERVTRKLTSLLFLTLLKNLKFSKLLQDRDHNKSSHIQGNTNKITSWQVFPVIITVPQMPYMEREWKGELRDMESILDLDMLPKEICPTGIPLHTIQVNKLKTWGILWVKIFQLW